MSTICPKCFCHIESETRYTTYKPFVIQGTEKTVSLLSISSMLSGVLTCYCTTLVSSRGNVEQDDGILAKLANMVDAVVYSNSLASHQHNATVLLKI
eukprot:scaffold16823_cov64-Cylindrotheca_fusiformis.AAC.1